MADEDKKGDGDETRSDPSALEVLQADISSVNHSIGKAREAVGTGDDPIEEAAASISSGDEETPILKKRRRRQIEDDDSASGTDQADPYFQIVDLCCSGNSSSSDDEQDQHDQKGRGSCDVNDGDDVSTNNDTVNGRGVTRQGTGVSTSSANARANGDRDAPGTGTVINLADSDGGNDSDESEEVSSSGFIPFASLSKSHPKDGKKGTGAAAKANAPNNKRSPPVPALTPFTLHHAAALRGVKKKQTKEKEEKLSRLWPSPSRFYRAVLRWVYIPEQCVIEKDALSAEKMMSLPSVSTKFGSLLEYQRVMSQLVLTETLASIEQALVGEDALNLTCIQGKICGACKLETTDGAAGSAGDDGKLFSLKIKLQLPRVTDSSGKELKQRCHFSGGDLLGLRLHQRESCEEVALGVVQSGDAVYDTIGKRTRSKSIMYVLVCANSVGGDGAGGPGGWLPLSTIQSCVSHRKSGAGVGVSLITGGTVMTASREFQAVMSILSFPERLRRCLLDPSVDGGRQRTRPALSSSSASSSSSRDLERGGGEVHGERGGKNESGMEDDSRPPNIPEKMWTGLQEAFNRSQLAAIRQVATGSRSSFTLLQGPPGTGKTRTIMGIVGVLLAGGCPDPTAQDSPASSQISHRATLRRGKGIKINVGASVSSGKEKLNGKQKGAKVVPPAESENTKTRVLIVAPSNAAVDELVIRLIMNGVPGPEGDVYFPNVVRVGGPRVDPDEQRDPSEGGRRGGKDGTRQHMSPLVQAVSLENLVEARKSSYREHWPIRLDVLLKAQVVCATLSGSGSYALVETVLLGLNKSEKQECPIYPHNKKNKTGKIGRNGVSSSPILTFDAVVMDEAAQAVEPSSLIPLKFNPRAVIMVGDPAQLPATIFSNKAKNANYVQSLFQRLQRGGHPKMMLDTQYRMHPSIASFPSGRFYNGLLRSAPTVTEFSHGQRFHRLDRFAPYLFHNVGEGRLRRGREEVSTMSPMSLYNPAEAEYIILLLRDLVCSFPAINFNGRVGVIAPYRNQIKALQKGMWKTGLRKDGVEISTVDGYQGREKDIIIFSCVRAPEQRPGNNGRWRNGIGFVGDWRRLNVAITRAKHSMWIVGHAGTLRQDNEWRELINDSKRRGVFVDRSHASSRYDEIGGSGARPYERFGDDNRGVANLGQNPGEPNGIAGEMAPSKN